MWNWSTVLFLGAMLPRWETPVISLLVFRDETMPDEEVNALELATRQAATDWSSECLTLKINVTHDSSSDRTERDGASRVLLRRREWCRNGNTSDQCYNPAALAMTTRYLSETSLSTLVEADIEINATNFDWFRLNGGRKPPVSLRIVLAHELGHVFGLSHQNALGNTIMTDAAHNGQAAVTGVSVWDRMRLCELYNGQSVSKSTPLDKHPLTEDRVKLVVASVFLVAAGLVVAILRRQ